MECPKCGAAQDDGREECSACGIVFARWQPRAPRRPTFSSTPAPEPATSGGIPPLFMVIGAAIVIVFGLMWTHYRHTRQDAGNGDEVLNDINNSGAKARRQLQENAAKFAAQQGRRGVVSNAIAPAALPADLDETKITNLIEACNFFREPVMIDIPKRFETTAHLESQHPLVDAYRLHLIAYEATDFGATTNVKVAPLAYSEVDVSEDPAAYHFSLGRRRVAIEHAGMAGQNDLSVAFRWTFAHQGAASLVTTRVPRDPQKGNATLRRTASGWTVLGVKVENQSIPPCG